MSRVLLIEDSRTFATAIKQTIESTLDLPVDWASSYLEAAQKVNDCAASYFISLVDLHLPDALQGEVLDLVLSKDIPPIVLTGRFGDEIRENIWSKDVIDYVLKDRPHCVDYVASLVQRILRNQASKVLVVEDSVFSRKHLCQLLRVHQYQVFEASHAAEALQLLETVADIRLAIVDYYMPQTDGIELTRKIRMLYPKEKLAIIGISAQGNSLMSVQFIKNGANDFILKPYVNEEFYCRINQNMDMLESLEQMQSASTKDFLTDLYNRRYLFESGSLLHANSLREHISLVVAMLDIDHFKQINDQYGHKAGDKVLQNLAGILKKRFRQTDIVARFGGEEFCIVTSNMAKEHIHAVFDGLRKTIADSEIVVDGVAIRMTVSIGVSSHLQSSFEEMINGADQLLYKAKGQGRNRVICS
jgi:diguanylate cyclase (GGDEF)-like protein